VLEMAAQDSAVLARLRSKRSDKFATKNIGI